MNSIYFTKYQQFPMSSETLQFMQNMVLAASNLALIGGKNFILSGCEEIGNNVSKGYVVVDGEIMPFAGGAKMSTVVIEETTSDVRVYNQTYNALYYTRQLIFGIGSRQRLWSSFPRNIDLASHINNHRVVWDNVDQKPLLFPTSIENITGSINDAFNRSFGSDGNSVAVARSDHRAHSVVDLNMFSIPNIVDDTTPLRIGYPSVNNMRLFASRVNGVGWPSLSAICYVAKNSAWVVYDINCTTITPGSACPFLYFQMDDGKNHFYSEVIKNQNNIDLDKEDTLAINTRYIVNGKLTIILKEEKDEISFIDYLKLVINGTEVNPENNPFTDKYIPLRKGETLELVFTITTPITDIKDLKIITKGYYQPLNVPKLLL